MQELKNIRTIRLPDEVVDYLQSLDYEIGGLQVLHTHAMNAGVPMKRTRKIRRQFQEKFQEYQLAKQEVFRTYGTEYSACKRWWVDFQEGEMHFEE